jgi:hypothetical protein
VVGSGKRPTQTTARRLPYGVARTNTSDFSAPRGRHRRRDMWIHRASCCAEEQATRTRVLPSGLLLRIDDGHDPARKASRPERARRRRPVCRRPSAQSVDTLRNWSFRGSRPHFCGITCSTEIVAAAMAPPISDVAQRRPRLEPGTPILGPLRSRHRWRGVNHSGPDSERGQPQRSCDRGSAAMLFKRFMRTPCKDSN